MSILGRKLPSPKRELPSPKRLSESDESDSERSESVDRRSDDEEDEDQDFYSGVESSDDYANVEEAIGAECRKAARSMVPGFCSKLEEESKKAKTPCNNHYLCSIDLEILFCVFIFSKF